jgi:hypothetical protein
MSTQAFYLKPEHLQKLQGLFLWLRLTSALVIATGIWQLFGGLGLIFSSLAGLLFVAVGSGLIWSSISLWRASKILLTITEEDSAEEMGRKLLDFNAQLALFFKVLILTLIFWVIGFFLLSVLGFLTALQNMS